MTKGRHLARCSHVCVRESIFLRILKCMTNKMWQPVFLLPLLLLHVEAASLKKDCPHPCIPLDQCPDLVKLVKSNPDAVRLQTCKVLGIPLPLVCCPSKEEISKPSLLPSSCGGSVAFGVKIFGGEQTVLGDFPWQAVLGYWNNRTRKVDFKCGGTVINERYVLTAAHCLDSPLHVVRLAEWDMATKIDCQTDSSGFRSCADEEAQDFQAEEIIQHPDYYKRGPVSDDIGLIRVSQKITFSRWIQPVCLPDRDFDVPSRIGHQQAIITGFGFTESGTTSNILLQVSLPLVDTAHCNNTYVERLSKLVGKQLCFGGVKGKDSCKGDSGGPAVMLTSASSYMQIGIVSFGPPCGVTEIPAVYVNVASYRDWIDETMKP